LFAAAVIFPQVPLPYPGIAEANNFGTDNLDDIRAYSKGVAQKRSAGKRNFLPAFYSEIQHFQSQLLSGDLPEYVR